ncbi:MULTISPECIES: trehalose-6-phosphate synthase [Acidobacterium]|uniref:Alpha,alpha-trehalose-phosphate synthase n=1 Tax=Acidobacterium capsulatum (strain ATCC 51196 / DSM 11244 / BCRC 80197 / JCM 7670 / NBRC 15755 / NCIMB 13165 / 161) TaxID=240015 RepID=C1F4D0_ACIC5|nr:MULTISPECIES: trehalose-6-phosphate synthase [Acidobacterium]ACO33164.1 alpha,alpha-trehalose-phosphate synthase [Acidobacterium capsulatum ATCC 51196]HCT61756.1 trehalose-6-phosphate synthase [Acidobacterium sp.]
MKEREVVIVSNRLPLSIKHDQGVAKARRSSGGLVTALLPILRDKGGVWIGNAGTHEDEHATELLQQEARNEGFACVPIYVTEQEDRNFYEGFSNQVLWPLFHDFIGECRFEPAYWEFYRKVNAKFADAVMSVYRGDQTLWVHDYQLMHVAAALRERGCKGRVAFFLHTPFPSYDVFAKLPWRRDLLLSLLQYDLIGLQTERDTRNLVSCLRRLVPEAVMTSTHTAHHVMFQGRRIVIQDFPISIDFEEFAQAAREPEVEERTRSIIARMGMGQMIFGVDRQDYTKGIPHRLRAYGALLRRRPDLVGRVRLVQIVVPSRQNIPGYEALKARIEHLVASINGEFTQPGWVPIHYIHRSIPREELLALYRAANVALVTPLKDGMNLVAKEFCATRIDDHGVLVLSEFAGAAAEMYRGALLVNPFDLEGVAGALEQALEMPLNQQQERMRKLRRFLKHANVHRWVNEFMQVIEHVNHHGSTRSNHGSARSK